MKRRRHLTALLALPILLAISPSPVVDGTYALQTGSAKTAGYLRDTSAGNDPRRRHLDLWMTASGSTRAIKHYTVDMTKLLHLIAISDDFTHFEHIHPVLGSDGHFTIDETFPSAGSYHVYADASPADIGQQVFRFDVGNGGTVASRSIAPTGTRVRAGPYSVAFSSVAIDAGRSTPLIVHVTRSGKPASDLHPYLGALAHVVVIDAHDLTYVHVHPSPLSGGSMAAMGSMAGMDMPGGSMSDMPALADTATTSPDMQLHLELRERGTYKVWFQFRGGSGLYVAPFTITAR